MAYRRLRSNILRVVYFLKANYGNGCFPLAIQLLVQVTISSDRNRLIEALTTTFYTWR